MAKRKSEIVFCPNCQQPALREGNEITCEKCDAIYRITKTDGAKVKSQGRLDFLEERIEKIEAALPGESIPEPGAEADAEGQGGGADEDEDGDIL